MTPNKGHYYYWKQQQQQPYYERNNAMTRLLHPQRVVQLSVLAMVLSECIFFVGIRLGTFVQAATPCIKAWWTKGRGEHGLFNQTTWISSSSHDAAAAAIVQTAWDRQFAAKYQWAIGCAVGMIVRPAAWIVVGTATAELIFALFVLADMNHASGPHLQALLECISSSVFAKAWGRVGVALEAVRTKLLVAIHKLLRVWQNVTEQVPHHQAIMPPKVLRKGFLTGTILGYLLEA